MRMFWLPVRCIKPRLACALVLSGRVKVARGATHNVEERRPICGPFLGRHRGRVDVAGAAMDDQARRDVWLCLMVWFVLHCVGTNVDSSTLTAEVVRCSRSAATVGTVPGIGIMKLHGETWRDLVGPLRQRYRYLDGQPLILSSMLSLILSSMLSYLIESLSQHVPSCCTSYLPSF